MKKKLLVSIVFMAEFFALVLSFTQSASAVELGELNLNEAQQKDILTAYDLNKDGKITSRDVTLMKQEIKQQKSNRFTEDECTLVQRCVVHDMQFTWCKAQVSRLSTLDRYISMGKLLYIDYFPNGENKIVAHINMHGRIIYVTYDYGKYGSRYR